MFDKNETRAALREEASRYPPQHLPGKIGRPESGGVVEALEKLDQTCTRAREVADLLERRLDPVMRPPGPATGNGTDFTPSAPMADTINSFGIQINESLDRIATCLDRLELP